jgi:hypothetical protein
MKGNIFAEMKTKVDDSALTEALRGRDAIQKRERDELKAYLTREMDARIKMGASNAPIDLGEVQRHIIIQITELQRERDGVLRQDIDDIKRNLTELTIHGQLVNQTEMQLYVQQMIADIPPHQCSTDSREWRMWFLSSLLSLLHRSIKHKTSVIRADPTAPKEPISLMFSPDPTTARSMGKRFGAADVTTSATSPTGSGNLTIETENKRQMENALRSLKERKSSRNGGSSGTNESKGDALSPIDDGEDNNNNNNSNNNGEDEGGAEEEEIATKLSDKVTTLGDKFEMLIHEMVCERRCPIPIVTKDIELLEPPTEPEANKSSVPEHAEKKRVLEWLLAHPRLLRLIDIDGRSRSPNMDDIDRLLIEGMGGKRTLSCLRVLDETECWYETMDDLIAATDEESMDSQNARRRAYTIMQAEDKSLKRPQVDELFEICDRPGAAGRPAVGGASTLSYLLQLQRAKTLDEFCTWPQEKQVGHIQDQHARAVVERQRVLLYLRDPANQHQFLRSQDPIVRHPLFPSVYTFMQTDLAQFQ